jgi:hypothetical protein
MRFTKYRILFAWDFEKEEKWLNEMSAKGMQLVGVGIFKYIFEEGNPGEYSYRIELLEELPTHPESIAYIRFMEDTGAEHIASILRWVYFRKKTSRQAFDLFSDIDSRINHLKKVLWLLGSVIPLEITAISLNMPGVFNGYPSNIFIICLLSAIFALLLYGFINLCLKLKSLKKERLICE